MINLAPEQFASWEQPIDMLYACHNRVKSFCRQLAILPEYLQKNGVNQAVKNDVQQILTYFNVAAPLHHDDEEKDFFPALLKYAPQAQKNIDELESQHIVLHKNWDNLSIQLQKLLDDEISHIEPELILQFISGYDVHIALEEPLFALGQQHIPAEELTTMGQIMANRRKI
ncbi:hemerythrin domain-containing protein [Pasteurellaceae bacterium 22721_9_1]